MSTETNRDRIEQAIGPVLFDVMNFPENVQARLLGQDMKPLRDKLIDACLVAGLTLPQERVVHVQGFTDERGVRGVHVSEHIGLSVVEVAKGVIESASQPASTRIVQFRRTWPLDGYGQEWSVTEVDAVTETTLDGGETWKPMWHWFGSLTKPWPLLRPVPAVPGTKENPDG